LKGLLDSLGIKRDGCFEKEDLLQKIKEYQNNKKPPSGPKAQFSRTETNYSYESKAFDSSAFDPPEPVNVFFKVISVGNSEVGKSCLIKRYCEGRFVKRYISTIGIDYGVKKLDLLGHKVCVNFFDLSGNEEYKLIRSEFYKDTNGVLLVFDVSNRDSFVSLIHWEEEMKRFGVDMTKAKVVLIGNKVDLKGREVSEAEA
jgi:small GTP-binding protein